MIRRVFFILGTIALATIWFGPLPRMAGHAFSAHMAMHMGVVALAAPLLVLGVAGTTRDPVRRWPGWFPAVPLSLVELIVVWAWHAPALHHFARHHAIGFITEQAAFLVASVAVWLAAFGGERTQRRERAGAGIAALLLTSMHMTLLGALLALTPRALYTHATDVAPLAALEDQHLGGAIMLVAGGAAYLAGGLCLTAELLRGSLGRRRTAA